MLHFQKPGGVRRVAKKAKAEHQFAMNGDYGSGRIVFLVFVCFFVCCIFSFAVGSFSVFFLEVLLQSKACREERALILVMVIFVLVLVF